MDSFLQRLPKIELHLHLEGTLESDLQLKLAKKHHLPTPFENDDKDQNAQRDFVDLQSFLDQYEKGLEVLLTDEDFEELAWTYFERAARDNVRHCEVFIDIQAHLARGVSLESQFIGLSRACQRAKDALRMSTAIVISFLRDRSEEEALEVLEQAMKYREYFVGIGLDSTEVGHPPSKFLRLYAKARQLGLHCVAHAGEEGPASYVREAIELLQIERIDHGNHCIDDPSLLQTIIDRKIPLTMCPLSNLKLKVLKDIRDSPIPILLKKGAKVTINSDDPAYFGGYILSNFRVIQEAFQLSVEDWFQLTRNAIDAAFISSERRQELIKELEQISKTEK